MRKIFDISSHVPEIIRLAVPRNPVSGAMLKITWEMDDIGRPADGWQIVKTTVYSRPPDTYVWLPMDIPIRRWHEIMSEAGWYLGSDHMARWIFEPCDMPHLWGAKRYLVSSGYFAPDESLSVGDANDIAHAAALNYGAVEWEIGSRWLRNGSHNMSWFSGIDPETNDEGLRLSPWPEWDGEHGWFGGDKPGKQGDGNYESNYLYRRPDGRRKIRKGMYAFPKGK
ncbi:MAG: hypothetical protein N2117_12925 [Anaerolineales bacterium]|nr:hypothetical protein [Anaerolineales bacterium]